MPAKLAKDQKLEKLKKVLENRQKIKNLESENESLLSDFDEETYIVKTSEGYRSLQVGKPEGGWVYYRKFDLVKNVKTSEKDKKYYGLF